MSNDKTSRVSPKVPLSLNKETLKNMTVRTGVKTGDVSAACHTCLCPHKPPTPQN